MANNPFIVTLMIVAIETVDTFLNTSDAFTVLRFLRNIS